MSVDSLNDIKTNKVNQIFYYKLYDEISDIKIQFYDMKKALSSPSHSSKTDWEFLKNFSKQNINIPS